MELVFKKLEIPARQTDSFVLSPLELKDFIDFEVKRIYFLTNTKAPTSAHCHKVEKELFVMVAGNCTAVIDKGSGLEDVPMAGPKDAIYVGNFVWHHFKDFSADAVLLALSSTNYDASRSDYIEDYEVYKTAISQNNQ